MTMIVRPIDLQLFGRGRYNYPYRDTVFLSRCVHEIAKNAGVKPGLLNTSRSHFSSRTDDGAICWATIIKHFADEKNNGLRRMTTRESIDHIFHICGIRKVDANIERHPYIDPAFLRSCVHEIAKKAGVRPEFLRTVRSHQVIRTDKGSISWLSIIKYFKNERNNGLRNMTGREAIDHIFKLCGIKKVDIDDSDELKSLVQQIARNAHVAPAKLSLVHADVKADNGETRWMTLIRHYQQARFNGRGFNLAVSEAETHILKMCGINRGYSNDFFEVKRIVQKIADKAGVEPTDLPIDKHGNLSRYFSAEGYSWFSLLRHFQKAENNYIKDMTQSESRAFILEKFLGIKPFVIYDDEKSVKQAIEEIARKAGIRPEMLTSCLKHLRIESEGGYTWRRIIHHYKYEKVNGEKEMTDAEAKDYVLKKFFNVMKKQKIDLTVPANARRAVLEIAKNANVRPKELIAEIRFLRVRTKDRSLSWYSLLYWFRKQIHNNEKEMSFGEAKDFVLDKFFGVRSERRAVQVTVDSAYSKYMDFIGEPNEGSGQQQRKRDFIKALFEIGKLPSELTGTDLKRDLVTITEHSLEELLADIFDDEMSWLEIIKQGRIEEVFCMDKRELEAIRQIIAGKRHK